MSKTYKMGGLALILLKFQVNNPKGCQLMELPPRDRGGPNHMQTEEPNEWNESYLLRFWRE